MERKTLTERLGRLVSKKGSVMFIVIVMMSVMIILATAVYYTVPSSRANVVMVYSDTQAYEAAINVLDMFENVIFYQDGNGSSYEGLYAKMLALDPSDAPLTTTFNLPGAGDVEVEIYAITPDGGSVDSKELVIKSTVTYNGKQISASRTFRADVKTESGKGFMKVFATTGLNSAPIRLSTVAVTSDLHFSDGAVIDTTGWPTPLFGKISGEGNLEMAGASNLNIKKRRYSG